MSRSKVTNRYPVYFLELVENYEKMPEQRLEIPCGDQQHARAYQLDLNCFRIALRTEQVIDMYPNFNHAEIKAKGTSVWIMDKDKTPSALITQRVLDTLKAVKAVVEPEPVVNTDGLS